MLNRGALVLVSVVIHYEGGSDGNSSNHRPLLSPLGSFFRRGAGGGEARLLSPSATTLSATSITFDGAILNATVNPKGLSTNAWFEYSKDPTLATNVTTTAPQELGSGSTDSTITQTLSGLDSGQTYHFRVTATSSAGTKKGVIFTFSTLPLPTVTTNPAGSITTSGATLNAIVNPNGRQTSAWFEYGITPALGTSTVNQVLGSGTDNVPVSTILTGLNAATPYYYRIVANSSVGTANGTILNFTTAGGVPLVTTKSAISVTTTSGVLRADVNPSGLATNAWFEYGTDNTFGNFATTNNQPIPAGTSAEEITAQISGLSFGETIYYRVAASNIVGLSLKGAVFSFFTNPPPTANAGPDQSVYMLGPYGDLGYLGKTVVALSGAGVAPDKEIISYLWEPTDMLDNSASPTPTFPAPVVDNVTRTNLDLQFKLTVTDNAGLTGTDNVLVIVKWGFSDDFSTDSTGTYALNQTLGTNSTFTYDSGGKKARVQTGVSEGIRFGKALKILSTGISVYTFEGVFSLDFNPTVQYGSGGDISIRLADSADPQYYFELSTKDQLVKKVVAGVPVKTAAFLFPYNQGGTYPIKITFSPGLTTFEVNGELLASLSDPFGGGFPVVYFEVETNQQDAHYDNIILEAAPVLP
jgi:hypothetical protein